MRDGLDGGGRFISADIVGVHTLSLLASSRVAHDRATGNYTQHNILHSVHTSKTVSKTRKEVTRGYST